MKVKNRKFLYNVENQSEWAFSHCHKPTPMILSENTIRVYFGTRSDLGITRTTYIDLDASDIYNLNVKYIHNKPCFDIGKIGTFDDSGANVSSIVKHDGSIYMYYIGWNPSTTVHTRNSIGLVIDENGKGETFKRLWDGSILDRTKNEPYYTGAVDVIKEKDIWKIWYTSGREWKMINGKPEIQYYIKYAESKNGIDWNREGVDCILPESEFEACARPSVFFEDNKYKMFYSKRRIDGFRIDPKMYYKVGYAESIDGKDWIRLDEKINFELVKDSWDSEGIAYPYILKFKSKKLCFYNGNGFGKSGFGYCIIEQY